MLRKRALFPREGFALVARLDLHSSNLSKPICLGIELETATATSAAAAAATAVRAQENEKKSQAIFQSTEELMKFQFMVGIY